jgi:hypothetical protein
MRLYADSRGDGVGKFADGLRIAYRRHSGYAWAHLDGLNDERTKQLPSLKFRSWIWRKGRFKFTTLKN